MVHMVVFNIGYKRIQRIKLQKRTVAFIRLGNYITAFAAACIAAEACYFTADNNGRVYAALRRYAA